MTSYRQSIGVVVDIQNRGEADRMFTLYTQAYGKVELEARSIRKQTSKLRGHIDLLSIVHAVFIDTRRGHRLIDVLSLERPRYTIGVFRRNKEFAQFLLRVIHGTEEDPALWDLCYWVFSGKLRDMSLLELQERVLYILGMLPEEGAKTKEAVHDILVANHLY